MAISVLAPIFPECSLLQSAEERPSACRVDASKLSDVIGNGDPNDTQRSSRPLQTAPVTASVCERESDMNNATIDGLSRRMADTYNGSKLAVKFLNASGWGPLLNLGYFELKQLPSLIGGLNHFQQNLVKKSVKLLNPQPNESILDLACGNGWTTQFIAQHGSKATGVDLCELHIKSAQSNFGKAGNINFIQGDATDLETVATPNSIDKIHCLEAAFHFGPEGRKALLNSAFHVLKPGGTFVLVDITWRTNDPERIDDIDPGNGFRETWQMKLFEPFESYTRNAKAIGFVETEVLDWTKPVMRILDVAALPIFMGQHSVTRKALEIARSEYSAITAHEWKLLLQELRLSQKVLAQSRYIAYIFTKPQHVYLPAFSLPHSSKLSGGALPIKGGVGPRCGEP